MGRKAQRKQSGNFNRFDLPVRLCLKTSAPSVFPAQLVLPAESVISAESVSPAKAGISSTHRFIQRDWNDRMSGDDELCGNDKVNENGNKKLVVKKQEFSNQSDWKGWGLWPAQQSLPKQTEESDVEN